MEVKTTLARGLQKSLGVLWKGNDFCDFTVVVDATSFRCHRFILSACSGFFQGLFRSQMMECQKNQVKVQGMTASTFDVILNSVYKGVNGLTVDNVLDVWSATEQLQMRYLTEECENFAIENVSVDNCFRILWQARLYSAEKVETHALHFISTNLEQVRNMEQFLELSFPDFYRVIESDDVIASSEDVVVETVLKWVDYIQHHSSDSKSSGKELDKRNYLKVGYNNNVEIDNSAPPTLAKENLVYDTNSCNTTMNQINNTIDNSIGNVASHTQETSINIVCASESQMDNNSQSTLPTRTIHQTGSLSESVNDSENSKSAQPVPGHCEKVCQNNSFVEVQREREDRKQHLFTLMSTCRLCLISSSCLGNIFHNPALLSCKKTLNLVTGAMMYKLCVERRHDPWPEAATHRVASNMKHVMVFMSNNKFWAYSLISGSVQEFADLPDDHNYYSAITICDNVLYIGYKTKENKYSFSLLAENKKWKVVNNTTENYSNCIFLAHGNSLYMVNASLSSFNCWYGCSSDWLLVCSLGINSDVVISFKQYILMIYYERYGRTVTVQYYNTKTKAMHTRPSSMNGTSAGIVSFTHLGDVFLLQKNGSLWKICSTDTDSVDFELVSKLWDKDIDLKGCVVYRKELFVFYHEIYPTGVTHLNSVPDLFRNIKLVAVNSESLCLPMVLPQSWLIVNNSKV